MPVQPLLPGSVARVVKAMTKHFLCVVPTLDVPVCPDHAEHHVGALPHREPGRMEPAAAEGRLARGGAAVAVALGLLRHGVALGA